MNPWAEETHHASSPPGRHRRGSTGSWTPNVASPAATGRHYLGGEPDDLPARGLLPVLALDEAGVSVFPPAQGELPAPRRTRVRLSCPADEDASVRPVAEETGLGTFNLGTVPASVTPPRSWRKAAWFATASSGSVVAALLFAGSALVGEAPVAHSGDNWVPGLSGGQPSLNGEHAAVAPEHPPAASSDHDSKRTRSSALVSPSSRSLAPQKQPTVSTPAILQPPASSDIVAPRSPSLRPKPSYTPAPYEADPLQLALPEGSAAEFAAESQKFFATVTEDPEAAVAMTTGKLRRQGASELARKYQRVAYFVVKHIKVHQYEGRTVCTVHAVYKDGTEATEQRVLTFAGRRISDVD